MMFGASKLGVINNVQLIKMVRKIQRGKKAIIKILLVTLQYVAWHLLCCFLQRSPGPWSRLLWPASRQHRGSFIPHILQGQLLWELIGMTPGALLHRSKPVFYTLAERKGWWIPNINPQHEGLIDFKGRFTRRHLQDQGVMEARGMRSSPSPTGSIKHPCPGTRSLSGCSAAGAACTCFSWWYRRGHRRLSCHRSAWDNVCLFLETRLGLTA